MSMSEDATSEYQLRCQSRGGVLRCHVSGDIDAQHVRIAYWHEILAIAIKRRARKLLVFDRKKHRPASPDELAELAQAMQVYLGSVDSVAIVEPTPKFLPDLEHGEIHAQSFGINLRVFSHEAEAERWLFYGEHDIPKS
jgi:hypothetical protein